MRLLNFSFNIDGLLCLILWRNRKAESLCCTITSHHALLKWNHISGGGSGPANFLLHAACALMCTLKCIVSISMTLGVAGEMHAESYHADTVNLWCWAWCWYLRVCALCQRQAKCRMNLQRLWRSGFFPAVPKVEAALGISSLVPLSEHLNLLFLQWRDSTAQGT